MNEKYKKRNKIFCPKCGLIFTQFGDSPLNERCAHCGCSTCYEINPKWNITNGRSNELWKRIEYGEITEEEYDEQWKKICQPFIDDVVRKRPEFSQELHDHIPVWEKRRKREWQEWEAHQQKLEDTFHFSEKAKKNPTITCPYCQSTDTKKISAVSRGLSFSIFGFGSKKVGKQWHCNKCGSDF